LFSRFHLSSALSFSKGVVICVDSPGRSLALTTRLGVNDVVLVDLATSARRADKNKLVVIEHVNKFYGALHVLKDITTTVTRGEVVVVIGPSGSGKSTLCRAINRLEPIDSGTIFIDGEPLPEEGKDLARLRADVGMVFQSFNLFAHKTALENVTLGPIKVRNVKPNEARERAMLLLERVGVADRQQSILTSFPADNSSALRSPAPWPWIQN
jgi:ABC-type histidine transport system ATPase subunit